MAGSGRSVFTPIRGLVKLVALVVGGTVSMLASVAALGPWVDSEWGRLAIAGTLLVVIPLFVADRALPRENPESARGLITDVIAILWMGGALAVAALGSSLLHGPLEAEATRLADDWPRIARLSLWLAEDNQAEASAEAGASEPEPELPAEPVPVAAPVAEIPAPVETVETSAPEAAPSDPDPPEEVKVEAPKELSPAELFTAFAPTVVTIRNDHARGSSAGTGFFVDDKGLIATNHHVIAGADKLFVKRFDGTETDKVELIDEDAAVDLALLRIEPAEAVPPAVIGDSDAITVGESVVVIGNPLGLEHTLTDGLVSSRRVYAEKRYIQMSAPVSPGNSGGPVFNRRGEVVGVTVAKLALGLGENLNLAIPVSELKLLIARDHKASKKFGASSW